MATGRQVDFTPVEIILCLAASLLVDHRRYGSSTSDRAEEPVPTLAKLFHRPNSSVLAKMANLDGSRAHGGKHEVEVATQLLSRPRDLGALYRLVLHAARQEGVGQQALPDFLDVEDGGRLELLGQEELATSDIEQALRDALASESGSGADPGNSETERLLVASARLKQHRFARQVLRNHGHRCVFCGLAVTLAGLSASRMLVASHIKAWRVSTPAERLDVRNGLAACPTHDVAFDTGLITVDASLYIHVKPELQASVSTDPTVAAAFGRPPLADQLLLSGHALLPDVKYLDWHHANVYGGVPNAPAA